MKLINTKMLLLERTHKHKLLILLIYAWAWVQASFIPNYFLHKKKYWDHANKYTITVTKHLDHVMYFFLFRDVIQFYIYCRHLFTYLSDWSSNLHSLVFTQHQVLWHPVFQHVNNYLCSLQLMMFHFKCCILTICTIINIITDKTALFEL
jgi:hypothetical protein